MKTVFIFLVLILLNSCGGNAGGTSSSEVTVKLSSFSTASYNPINWFIPKAYASVSSLTICPTQIRLKTAANDASDDQSYDQLLSFATDTDTIIGSTGTTLGTFSITNVTAVIIEIDLGTTCSSGKSIQFTNDSGSYSSTETMKLKFTGTLDIIGSFTLSLDPQNQLDTLNTWTSSNDILDLDTVITALAGALP